MVSKCRLAIFDFDDTMALHKDRDYVKHRKETGESEYYRKAFEHPYTFYEIMEPCDESEELKNLIGYFRIHNVKMYCLSAMRMSLHARAKQFFINHHYGEDIELLSVSSQDGKVEAVKILQEIHGCEPCEVLYIDDVPEIVTMMQQHGYVSVLSKSVGSITVNGRIMSEIMDD